jgi:uncharacterized protein
MNSLRALLFNVALVTVSLGAHWVVLSWAQRSFGIGLAKRGRRFLACAAFALNPPLWRAIVLHARSPVADAVFACFQLELVFFVALLFPLLGLALVSKLANRPRPKRAARADVVAKEDGGDGEAAIGRRGAIETIGGVAAVGATGLAFGWGMTVGRHGYEVREIAVRIAGLPKSLDGYVVAQISDIHAGLFVGERELREGAELIRGVRPDLLVVTGDLVDFDPRRAPALSRALADLAPRDGVFAILGNHDYYAGHVEVSAAVRAAGITLLVNESRLVRPADGGGFALVGVDEMWSQRYGGPGPNLREATASLSKDVPRILLAHHPEEFQFTAGKVALQLSGHTHGGQIRPANLILRGPVAGRYDGAGSVLYVNRGFGVSGPPARLGVPPEITKLVLVSA